MALDPAKFVLGGVSCMAAALVTNPVDVVKTQMQLHGELGRASGSGARAGLARSTGDVWRAEGLRGFYRGIVPSLLREGSYSTLRMGLYEPFRALLTRDGAPPPLWAKIAAGAAAGATGAGIANPTDLVKVRMQARSSAHKYRGTLDAFATIWRDEGLPGFYRGVMPTVYRAMLLTSTQLASYDHTKQTLLRTGLFRDDVPLHLLVSMIAGLFCAITTAPVDNIKSRYMNQPFNDQGRGTVYRSTLDCFAKTIRAEGLRGTYKGFLANWMRIGPHTIVTFIIFEQLRLLAGLKPF